MLVHEHVTDAADGRDKVRSQGQGFNWVLQAAGTDLASRSHTHALTDTHSDSSGQGQPADTGPRETKALSRGRYQTNTQREPL